MRYKIELKLNDGKAEMPPYEVEVDEVDGLAADLAIEELTNDYGEPFGVGTTLTITRIA